MLTEVCQYLHNWFDRDQAKFYGQINIESNLIQVDNEDIGLTEGQYFRIIGSLLNDGVYQYPSEELQDESFRGAIWSMALPPAVLALSEEINEWQEKYGGVSSQSMSPYQSESFGGYAYSKAGGGSAGNGTTSGWQDVYANRLSPWRKII